MRWDVDKYNRNAGYVSEHGEALLELLAPIVGETILDVGCGDGRLAEKIVAFGCTVVGIDSSAEMIEATRSRGIEAYVLDAQAMSFDYKFDAVFSNAALHWMKDADAVIGNVHTMLKSGGRFCAEFGAQDNVGTIVSAMYAQLKEFGLNGDDYNPWYFPSGSIYQSKLEQHGFQIIKLDVFARPTQLPTDIIGWLDTFGAAFLKDIPSAKRADFMSGVAHKAAGKLKDKNGDWFADYVRCRFLARKI